MSGLEAQEYLLEKLGKHKTGQFCLYIEKLAAINEERLQALITESVEQLRTKCAK